MLVDVPARFRVRRRVKLNARDVVFEPYLRRKAAVVLFGVHSAGAIVFCRHSLTISPAGCESTDPEQRSTAETHPSRHDRANGGISGRSRLEDEFTVLPTAKRHAAGLERQSQTVDLAHSVEERSCFLQARVQDSSEGRLR